MLLYLFFMSAISTPPLRTPQKTTQNWILVAGQDKKGVSVWQQQQQQPSWSRFPDLTRVAPVPPPSLGQVDVRTYAYTSWIHACVHTCVHTYARAHVEWERELGTRLEDRLKLVTSFLENVAEWYIFLTTNLLDVLTDHCIWECPVRHFWATQFSPVEGCFGSKTAKYSSDSLSQVSDAKLDILYRLYRASSKDDRPINKYLRRMQATEC